MSADRHAILATFLSVVGILSVSAAGAGDPFTGSRWAIVEVYGELLAQDETPHISFEDQGRISGHTACNWFHGSYSLDADRILLITRLTTLRGCEVGNRRQRDPTLEALDSTAALCRRRGCPDALRHSRRAGRQARQDR